MLGHCPWSRWVVWCNCETQTWAGIRLLSAGNWATSDRVLLVTRCPKWWWPTDMYTYCLQRNNDYVEMHYCRMCIKDSSNSTWNRSKTGWIAMDESLQHNCKSGSLWPAITEPYAESQLTYNVSISWENLQRQRSAPLAPRWRRNLPNKWPEASQSSRHLGVLCTRPTRSPVQHRHTKHGITAGPPTVPRWQPQWCAWHSAKPQECASVNSNACM